MELVYVLVLEAKFCGFESHPGHQIGVEASMVMQWTVNPPPLARLVRSQDTPPNYGNVAESGLLQQS